MSPRIHYGHASRGKTDKTTCGGDGLLWRAAANRRLLGDSFVCERSHLPHFLNQPLSPLRQRFPNSLKLCGDALEPTLASCFFCFFPLR